MDEADVLPFYQHFFTETLFVLPEKVADSIPDSPAGSASAPPVAPAPSLALVDDGAPATKKFALNGQNKKGLALIFSLPEVDFASLPQNEFLTKILAAIQHTPLDVAYVNLPPNFALNLFDLSKVTQVNHVVAFGNGLVDLAPGFKINMYKPAGVGNVPLLLAEPLELIQNDVNRKKYLWSGLQAIFVK